MIRVGTAPVNWGIDPDYTWIEQRPYQIILDEMKAAGYDATEWAYNFPADPETLSRELAQRNMVLASSFCSVDFAGDYDPEPALVVCRLLACLGVQHLVVAQQSTCQRRARAGRVRPEDGLSDDQWRRLTRNVADLAERVHAMGLVLTFHNHAGTAVESGPELARLCADTDPQTVRLCLDTGHLAYGGSDPVAFAREHRARLGYIHLKDVDAGLLERVRADGLDFLAAVRAGIFVELGEGALDLDGFMACLRKSGYDGWLIVEQDGTRKTPLESARLNRRYLAERFGL